MLSSPPNRNFTYAAKPNSTSTLPEDILLIKKKSKFQFSPIVESYFLRGLLTTSEAL